VSAGEDEAVTEPTCTCDGRQEFVCCDIRDEPHLVGCPRWGTPLYAEGGYIDAGAAPVLDTTCWFPIPKDPS
jgi:hypothetical protein